jgi:hypothetical protein
MLIDLELNKKISEEQFSGVEIHEIDDSKNLLGLMHSPNHPNMPFNPERRFGLILKDYMDYYVNDSVLILDYKNNKLFLGRDWPGNVMIYYWLGKTSDGIRFIASDNIARLIKMVDKADLSRKGISQYLKQRKHYQSYTVIEGVNIIQPGFFLELDLNSGKISFSAWYKFHTNILIQSPSRAVLAIRNALDASINRLVSKDDEIALMFSGGSDSALLLDRLTSRGYRNISLFNVGLKGKNSERERSMRTAKFYGFNVNQIDVESDQAMEDWINVISHSYMGRSYSRINGWLSVLPSVYRRLIEHYESRRVNVMWGYVHPFMLNNSKIVRMPLIYIAYILIKRLKSIIKKYPEIITKILPSILGVIVFLEKENYTEEEYEAIKTIIIDVLGKVEHPDELVNLKMMMGLTNQKVWTMHRQRTVADIYYPQARNVFPYVDRQFQEFSGVITLRARFGGFARWMKVTNVSRKNLTLNAFEKKIQKEVILGGNYEAESDWQSLFRNGKFYSHIEKMIESIKKNKFLSSIIKENMVILPESEQEYLKMRYRDMETLMSLIMLKNYF